MDMHKGSELGFPKVFKDPKEGRSCPLCGKPRRWGQKTCGARCGYQLRKLKARKPKKCPICKEEFWPTMRSGAWTKKYCSRQCYLLKVGERHAMIEVTCEQCARIFRRTKAAVARVKRVFCNKVCSRKFYSGTNHPHWRGGHDPNRGPAWQRLAAQMRKRDHYRCQRCNLTQEENGQKLDVDHIIPWRLFDNAEQANDPRNLASLCRRCHRIKTATFERAMLKGDCMGMYQYEDAIRRQPLKLF